MEIGLSVVSSHIKLASSHINLEIEKRCCVCFISQKNRTVLQKLVTKSGSWDEINGPPD